MSETDPFEPSGEADARPGEAVGSEAGRAIIRLLWDPPGAPSRGPKPKTSLDEVVSAGIAVADSEGLPQLSMRKVAGRLGVGAMSLYTYVPGRDELVELMVDQVHGELVLPGLDLAWRASVEHQVDQRWRLYQRHPWLLELNMARMPLGPNVMGADEALYTAISRAGLRGADVVSTTNLILWQLLGAARAQITEDDETQRTGTSAEAYWESRASFWETYFSYERYPTMAAIWEAGGFDDERTHAFDRILSRLLDALESSLRPWPARARGGHLDHAAHRPPARVTTMTRSVYIASPEGLTGKSAIAIGLLDALTREVESVGVFRPLVHEGIDLPADVLIHQPGITQDYDNAIGVTYEAFRDNPAEAMHAIVERFGRLSERYDVVLVLGSDYTDIATGTELTINARIAANLGSPVVLVVHGRDRSPEEVRAAAEAAMAEMRVHHAHPVAVVVNRTAPELVEPTRDSLAGIGVVVGALPEEPMLSAPTVRAQAEAVGADLVLGSDAWLDRESDGLIVAAMGLPNVLTRLRSDVTVIAPGDRGELLPGLLMAHQSGTFPSLAGIVLTGGYPIPDQVQRLLEGTVHNLPILSTELETYSAAATLATVRGPMTSTSTRKLEVARRLFSEHIDTDALLKAIDVSASAVVTPLMFEYQLMERAREANRHIVLPESSDDRILEAAAILLRRGVARLTLLGEENSVRARAKFLGLDLEDAAVVSPRDPELVERFANVYAAARAHKGMTVERARGMVTDVSYFGTMMVHLGLADGMVSGAANTTAHTIRPALEFVKTRPGVSTVSSVFLMCLADRVLVYGDCAVVPDPTAEQLADIAVSSAETAAQFGIEPRVAMLSYSTGSSGSGAEVEKVRQATTLVAERRPDLPLEGPIQYDAAVDLDVARTKLPESDVAGRATVFVFPDLNTGNNTYKAVQRSAHAIAIGPVLQGLRRPVNDLSRGALVSDIVNTVAITAVQALGGERTDDGPAASPLPGPEAVR